MAEPLSLLFMGTPEIACVSLRALLGSSAFRVLAVVTQPDRPKGRSLKPQPPPVKALAIEHGLPVLQPERVRSDQFQAAAAQLKPAVIVVVAFGQILPVSLLQLPQYGCVNVHTSLLPKYRGAAPIQWAILNDETRTGVTLMKMDAGMDTGDIIAQTECDIAAEDTAITLHDRLAQLGADLLLQQLPRFVAGAITPRPQPAQGVTLARKITKEDGKIDWSQPARAIWNRVRGLVPWPGAFSVLQAEPAPCLLKIWEATPGDRTGAPGIILEADKAGILVGCGEGSLQVRSVQREGGRKLTAGEFLAGHPLRPGDAFQMS